MSKIDYKKNLKEFYRPSAKKVVEVNIPKMNFLMGVVRKMERELSLTEISQYLSWNKNKDSTEDLLSDYVIYKSAMSEIPNSLNLHEKKKISEWDSALPNLWLKLG